MRNGGLAAVETSHGETTSGACCATGYLGQLLAAQGFHLGQLATLACAFLLQKR